MQFLEAMLWFYCNYEVRETEKQKRWDENKGSAKRKVVHSWALNLSPTKVCLCTVQTHSLPESCLCMFMGRTEYKCVCVFVYSECMCVLKCIIKIHVTFSSILLFAYIRCVGRWLYTPEIEINDSKRRWKDRCYCARWIYRPSQRNNDNSLEKPISLTQKWVSEYVFDVKYPFYGILPFIWECDVFCF